ncbi:hypothetical protein ABIC08_009168 [Bradyrhizobium sp. RT9b]
MVSRFYRLRMGAYAATLFRSSKRDPQQRHWLQYSVMRLGCELGQSEPRSNAAEAPVRNGYDACIPSGRISNWSEQVSADTRDLPLSPE